jgi:hypothetical protein
MAEDGEPRWAWRTGSGPLVFRDHSTDNVLINLKAGREGKLLSDSATTERAPPRPMSLSMVAIKGISRMATSRIGSS